MKTKVLLSILAIIVFSCNLCLGNLTSEVSFSVSDVVITAKGEFTSVSLPGSFHTTQPGAPDIPLVSTSFVIPQDVRVTGVRVLSTEREAIPGDFYLYPAQQEVPIGFTAPFAEPDDAIYESKSPYPGKVIEVAGDGFMGGYHVAGLFIYPLEYVPSERRLYFYSTIRLELQYEPAERQYVAPPYGVSRSYEDILRRNVKNPEDIRLHTPSPTLAKVVSPPDDSIPFVIITNEDMHTSFLTLADWKTKKGTRTEVKGVSSIETEYPGIDLAEKIRSFIQDTYQNRYTQWILLGGDVSVIPARYVWIDKYGGVLTDQYYSCLDGNWNFDGDTLYGEVEDSVDLFPEVYVGRVPAVNFSQASLFVSKLTSYERDSPYHDYQTKALFLSSHMWDEIDNQQFSDSLSRIFPGHFSKTSLYEYGSETGMAYMDSGFGIITNYCHAQNSGNFLAQHSGGLDPICNEDIDTLQNTQRFSVVLNVTCWNNNLAEDCLSKHFFTCPAGGAAGYIGSSFFDFPYTTRGMHVTFFDKLFNEQEVHVGRTLALAKLSYGWFLNWFVTKNNSWRYTYFSYLLLGDPQMEIWTEEPHYLALFYPSSLDVGYNSFDVKVDVCWFGGECTDLPNALVCLRKDDEVYELRRTDSYGYAHFEVDFPTSGTATVVASKAGVLPKEVCITVGPPPPGCPYVSVWNGAGFERDNVILTASEDDGRDEVKVVDYCPLRRVIVPKDDRYVLEISEFENETSYLDHFSLIVADYPANQRIGVTPEGKVVSFQNPISPVSCFDQNGADCLGQILHQDGSAFESLTKGSLTINFGQLSTAGSRKIAASLGEGGGPDLPQPPKNPLKISAWRQTRPQPNILYVDVVNRTGEWENVGKVYPRATSMTRLLDLSQHVIPSRDFRMRLRWERSFAADHIAYYTFSAGEIEVNTLPLASAVHSAQADVTNELVQVDDDVALLSPGERIRLSFATLDQDMSKKRMFILAASGYYESSGETPTAQPGSAPFGENPVLWQNYPNPFNPQTEIKYVLPNDCRVNLAVYNVLGQRVRVLVDRFEASGYKSINWDGRDEFGNEVANGIYFCRLRACDFDEVRKMVVVK